jgi:hypothetical protein
MGTKNRQSAKIQLLEASQVKRERLIEQVRRRLRQRAKEAKMWQELFQMDSLMINGRVVWKQKNR